MTLRADDLAMSSNPYSTITERNVFALVPIPPPGPATPEVVVDPPPKIIINGMMTLFGKPQVLFKFTPKTSAGQQPKETSLVLGEGERQEEVEVTKIDMQGHMASFINHGIAQDVALSDTAKLNAPVSGSPGGPMGGSMGGGIPMPASPGMAPGMMGRGLRGRGAAGMTPQDGTPNSNPADTAGATGGQPTGKAAIEDQVMGVAKEMAQIELNRIETQDLVDQGKLPPLPPTMLTPKDATAADGSPLIAPNEPPSGPVNTKK